MRSWTVSHGFLIAEKAALRSSPGLGWGRVRLCQRQLTSSWLAPLYMGVGASLECRPRAGVLLDELMQHQALALSLARRDCSVNATNTLLVVLVNSLRPLKSITTATTSQHRVQHFTHTSSFNPYNHFPKKVTPLSFYR